MDQVQQIRDSIDLVSYVSSFLTLKKTGQNYKAVCPFHNEKSPSFVVSPERQIWHCFGCGKGGDVYTFLMEYERVEFPEALRILAKQAGIQLIQSKFETAASSKKDTLYTLNAIAAEYYHYVLTKHAVGERARLYVKTRGVKDETVKTFLLGFAPVQGSSLTTYLVQRKHYDPELLWEAGLVFKGRSGYMDFFRGRIMFPLFDHRDNIAGFSGRIFEETDGKQAKYVNTKETLVYHKGEMFFGLNTAKEAIKKQNQAIVVEGEFDVISCFQEGISNVIAVKGTAFTPQQAALLKRYTSKVTMCLDSDAAGQDAIKRSVPILEQKGLTATVITIPGGKDPDEIIKTDPYAFKKIVKADINAYDFLLSYETARVDKTTADGKKTIANELLPFFLGIENEIIKEHYVKKLSHELDTTYESIQRLAERQYKKAAVVEQVTSAAVGKKPREEILEEYLISLIVQYEKPFVALKEAVQVLSETITKERAYQKILHHLLTYFETTETFEGKQFTSFLPSELIPSLNKSLLFPLPQFPSEEAHRKEITRVAYQLRDTYLKQKIKHLTEKIKEKEEKGEDVLIPELEQQLSRSIELLSRTAH